MQWNSTYTGGQYYMVSSGRRVYYFWFFGCIVKLPYSHRASRSKT